MRSRVSALAILLLSCVSRATPGIDPKTDPKPDEIPQIIKAFTQKETEFAAARESYTYRQTSKISETEPAGGSYSS